MQLNTNIILTVTVVDAVTGDPVSGVDVQISTTNPSNLPDFPLHVSSAVNPAPRNVLDVTTDDNGTATFTLASNGQDGDGELHAWPSLDPDEGDSLDIYVLPIV